MSRETLYVSNLSHQTTKDQLLEMFSEFGHVISVESAPNGRFENSDVIVTFDGEKSATRANATLNGVEVNGKRLAISYPDLDEEVIERGLSKKARQTAEEVCHELGETGRKPVRRIHTMVLVCGHNFVKAILEEAKIIYAGEGLPTNDGSRKRTLGGVFFYLANPRMSPPIYRLIHLKGGKLPGYQKIDDRAIYHLIENPHEEDMEYYNQLMAK